MSGARFGWAGIALVAVLGSVPAASAQPADLFIEAELDPPQVYVGGEARLRLRLYRAAGVIHGTLRLPALGDAADVTLLGPIRTYATERSGKTYEVLERSHVIVPHRSGRLVIPGAEFESAQRYAELFTQGAGGARSESGAHTAHGPQHELKVREPPAAAAEPWLPVRRLTLGETWSRDPDALTAGTAVTRTLILRAEGIAAERLPKLEMVAHPALLVHHDQPEVITEYLAEGMASRRVQRIVLMPVAEAHVELPALGVSWWDVNADVARTATLDGRVLRLHAAVAPVAMPRQSEPDVQAPAMPWWALAAGTALLASVLWWRWRTRASRAARTRLRAACRRNDAPAARDALRDWGRAVALAAPQLVQRIGAAWPDEGARAQLGALDEALYAGRAWDGDVFWRAVRPWLRTAVSQRQAPESPRRPLLFRLQGRSAVVEDDVRR